MSGNICTRCGKVRVVVSTYDETVQTSTVTYTIMECPDPNCQAEVDKNLVVEDQKRKFIKDAQVLRELQRQGSRKRKANNKVAV